MNKYLGRSFKPAEITARREELESATLLSGRPARQTVIGADDITNLRIAIETSSSIDDFIRKV